jgi:ribosomal protein S18 acetylase RimI-like enzyme
MRTPKRANRSATRPEKKIRIRQARREDLRKCARILHTKELAGANDWYPTANVLKRCMGKYFLVAEENGKTAGCIVVEPLRNGVIGWWFAVAEGARGRGVGSALLDAIERTAKKDGKYFFLIYSKVGSKALRFYRKRGYESGQDYTELIKRL